jgi:hypothetical protein
VRCALLIALRSVASFSLIEADPATGGPKLASARACLAPSQIFYKIPATDFSRSRKIFRDENSSRRSRKFLHRNMFGN